MRVSLGKVEYFQSIVVANTRFLLMFVQVTIAKQTIIDVENANSDL